MDIEITRLRRNHYTLLLFFLVAAVVVVFFLVYPHEQITSYGGSKTSSHVFLLSESQVEKMKSGGVSSDSWSVSVDSEIKAGSTIDKDAVVENQACDGYVRVIIKITDKNGDTSDGKAVGLEMNPTTDDATKSRLRKIMGTIYYDKGSNLREGTSYTKAELNEMKGYSRIASVYNHNDFESENPNDDIALDGWNESLKAYTFLYKSDNANKFFKSSSTRFFTNVLIPTDATDAEREEIGNFNINVSVQAIAMDGFADRTAALASFN